MCGICGVYNRQSQEPISKQFLERMTAIISHRGPDEGGMYLAASVGLGFARLSIIDVQGSQQPIANETGEIHLVFNGEIWNYQALRRELQARGHQFRSKGDTEVIVHAYEEYGLDCLAHLHGMFAFALWDAKRQSLFLARDRLGKKPLYYTLVDGDLLFASEIKALLLDPRVKKQVDVQNLADFLSIRYVPGPATLFAGIYKVLPAHFLLFADDTFKHTCYWDYQFNETEQLSTAEYIVGVKKHLYEAIQERLMADVPLGALLSGGIDSSIIVGIMSSLMSSPLKTFTVGFDVGGYSELPYARLVAQHFKTEHFELVLNSADLFQYWPLLTWHRDEPVCEASDLAVYLISRFARQQVKVVFSGEGSDELFAGYPKYAFDWLAKYARLLPASLRTSILPALSDRLPYSMRKLKLASLTLLEPAPQRWISWFGAFNGPLKERLLSPALKARVDLDTSRIFRSYLEHHPQRDDVSSMLYLDTRFWLPDNLLMKADKMSMAASLEARLPFLDSGLVEYAASIPSQVKMKPFKPKYLLKQAFAEMLPRPILTRKKMGFPVPVGFWFRQNQRSLIAQLLLSERTRSRNLLDYTCVEQMLKDHLDGRTDYQLQLFLLASLELWFRVFIDATNLKCPSVSIADL